MCFYSCHPRTFRCVYKKTTEGEELRNVMTTRLLNPTWNLKEFIQVGPESFDNQPTLPLQLLERSLNKEESAEASLWLMGGFQGTGKNDSQILNLVLRAVQTGTFSPAVDLFLTPVVNPTSRGAAPRLNKKGENLSAVFEQSAEDIQQSGPLEIRTLLRWMKSVNPKALITFSTGLPMIRYLNTPVEIMRKLSEISDLEAHVVGTEPQEKDEDEQLLPREALEHSFGSWCATQGVCWIDFCIDRNKKAFDDLKESDWKTSVGPALKWLVEGFRFNPPEEEQPALLPKVVPVLEMPPEFANL